MVLTEQSRHHLYEGLIDALGQERATTLMELLPPVGWADVATKRDLDHQSASILAVIDQRFAAVDHRFDTMSAEIDQRFTAMSADIDQRLAAVHHRFDLVQNEVGTLRSDLTGEIGMLRSEVTGEIGALRNVMQGDNGMLRSDVHAEMSGTETRIERALPQTTHAIVFSVVASNASIAGIVFAMARLV